MPDYHYWATTESGGLMSGRLTAASPDEAAHLLTLRGWVLQRLEESTPDQSAALEPVPLNDADFQQAEESLRELDSGLPLVANLRALAEETGRPRTRRALFAVIAAAEQGRPWEQALGELEAALPRRFGTLIQAGVATGRLPFLMHHALEHLRRMQELRRRLWIALIYPAALIAAAAGVISFILIWIVPNFKRIFEDFGTELPTITAWLISLSDTGVLALSIFTVFGWWTLPLLCALGGGLLFAAMLAVSATSNLPEVRRARQRVLRLLPVVGPVLYASSLSGWFRLVGMLVEARLPLPEALRIAATVNGDALLSSGVERMLVRMASGESPLQAAEQSDSLPREVLPIFRWAYDRELFREGMHGAAEIYAARSRMQSGLVTVLLEPLLVFSIGISVGLVVIALFMPLIKLLNDLA